MGTDTSRLRTHRWAWPGRVRACASRASGTAGYMTKPFSPTSLLARVEEALGL
ncbi:MAG: hypothetical protein VW450_07785 [Chloroflexota bacterium]